MQCSTCGAKNTLFYAVCGLLRHPVHAHRLACALMQVALRYGPTKIRQALRRNNGASRQMRRLLTTVAMSLFLGAWHAVTARKCASQRTPRTVFCERKRVHIGDNGSAVGTFFYA